ncbi:choice-of-anchor B family protein [Crocinitomix catalasitica]|uniref:choice-of-anchor B family protein n=1 Tax=Crocinitomix catalasitica TaxID=184607 RepID=UPI0004836673|nr:choice-of-anchor B family protein [Crocinitomix catalasitica]
MKTAYKSLLSIVLLILTPTLYSQLNINEIGYLDIPALHDTKCNDIWGYVDELGNEYAIVGTEDGVSIVDVTVPADVAEVAWIPGMNSIWRDIKTYGDFAYVTTEALEGLLIIDLSPLPFDTELPTRIYSGPALTPWQSAHNIYQTDGYAYIFGAGRGAGGVIILDVATDPWNPTEVGVFDNWYAHDGYVQNDTGYFAHIYDGFFSVVDLREKAFPVLLGSAVTPTAFTHNIWATEDGNYVFTTDEISDGYIGSFDVSNPESIVELDRIQSSPGSNRVPHNSHVKGDYLYTSYYTDGLVVHDISDPNNIIEVANFDTSPLTGPTTEGCWGAYPFLPSDHILATDREEGLFVFDVLEHPASYLNGTITESITGTPLNNVSISIESTDIEDFSNVPGYYATGIESEGIKMVDYFKVLYYPQSIPLNFVNGATRIQDVELEKIPEFSIDIKVLDSETLLPIEGVNVLFSHTYIDSEAETDIDGNANIPLYYQDNYQVSVGIWGYKTVCLEDIMLTDETGEIIVQLDKGYYDDFSLDFNWTSGGTASRGHWVRDIPVGVDIGENPYFDSPFDCGKYAYITGNGTSSSNTQEVNDGEVILVSPIFSLVDYVDPYINYATWFFNLHGAPPDDTLFVYIISDAGVEVIDKLYNGGLPMSQWNASSIRILDFTTPSDEMQIMFMLSDYVETENITEGAVDFFSITESSLLNIPNENKEIASSIKAYPNPFQNTINIEGVNEGFLVIYDISGKQICNLNVEKEIKLPTLESGVYLFEVQDLNSRTLKIFKQIKY